MRTTAQGLPPLLGRTLPPRPAFRIRAAAPAPACPSGHPARAPGPGPVSSSESGDHDGNTCLGGCCQTPVRQRDRTRPTLPGPAQRCLLGESRGSGAVATPQAQPPCSCPRPELGRCTPESPLRGGQGGHVRLAQGPAQGRRGPRPAAPLIFRPEGWPAGHPTSPPDLLGLHCPLAGPDRAPAASLPPPVVPLDFLTSHRGLNVLTRRDSWRPQASLPTASTRPGSTGRACVNGRSAQPAPLLPALVLVERR